MNNLICREFTFKINKKNIDHTKTIGNFGSGRPLLLFHMKYSKTCIFILLCTVCALFLRCANQVAPEGGPKDTKPPKVLNSSPPNFSTNFKDNSIKIDFNEFITIKNQAAEVNVSPPLKTLPDLKLRGKSLVIKLEDTLAANTTYSIDLVNLFLILLKTTFSPGFRMCSAQDLILILLACEGRSLMRST